MATSFALATPAPLGVADGAGAGHPRRLPRYLRVAAGRRRAGLRPRRDRQPQDRPEDHADPGPARGAKELPRKRNTATAADLVERRFDRLASDQLWVTDITEHPTREGKVYCCVVLDVFSRRVVGWAIDSHQATPLVTGALGTAIHNRNPGPDQTVIHSDSEYVGAGWSWVSCLA
jgi:transposase InsO family protein